ncbi:Tyrosine-specific transport protein [Nymphaea thermarum]|nr:Tyrosine-specific transport protein [Nymphaea thermarum]
MVGALSCGDGGSCGHGRTEEMRRVSGGGCRARGRGVERVEFYPLNLGLSSGWNSTRSSVALNGVNFTPFDAAFVGRVKFHPPTIECSTQGAGKRDEYGGGGRGGKGEETEEFERLFSNLNQVTLKRDPGSLSSAVFLVAGTTVGAGILAIPAVTQESGFLASSVTCVFCWLYMVVTGLLIAEVNVNTMCELGSGGVSLVSMAMRTLGKLGVQVACWSYLFIHYALLVAYVARSSDILATSFSMPFQRFIGAVNGILVFGILISFTTLVVLAGSDIQLNSLLKFHLEAIPQSIPVIALAFVYQVSITRLMIDKSSCLVTKLAYCFRMWYQFFAPTWRGTYQRLGRALKQFISHKLAMSTLHSRIAIVLGTAIPLVLFLIWDAVILGTVPNFDASNSGFLDPLQQLRSNNGLIGPVVELFSFLAIGTSYIGFVLGLSDFVSDLLKQPAGQNRPLPYLLTIFPPLVLAFLDPEIFFRALDFAGAYGVLVLFGVLPAAMSWSERYNRASSSLIASPLVPGGRLTISFVAGGAGWVILSEILANFS